MIPTTPVAAQTGLEAVYDSAYYAWEAGAYPEALRGFDRVLAAPQGEAWLDRIAAVTGERYRTTEVAPDGAVPAWSADGRRLRYETGSAEDRRTHVVEWRDGVVRPVVVLEGANAQWSPTGARLAYLRLDRSPVWEQDRAQIMHEIAVRSRADFVRRRARLRRLDAVHTRVMVWDAETGSNLPISTGGFGVTEMVWAADGQLYGLGHAQGTVTGSRLLAFGPEGARPLTPDTVAKTGLRTVPGRAQLLYTTPDDVATFDVTTRRGQRWPGFGPAVAADGSVVAWFTGETAHPTVVVLTADGAPRTVARLDFRADHLALSPTGDRIVLQGMPRENWELFELVVASGARRRLTHEVQHDLFPQFLTPDLVLAVLGEGRHRRSYLHDLARGTRTRFFHNNTIRTVAPEYAWVASPDGSKVAIVAERDGDTISPERGLYVVDRDAPLTRDAIRARIADNLARETALRERGRAAFAPMASAVEAVVADVTTARIYDYEADLFRLGSKYITEPGNGAAIAYLTERLRGFGYEPELQWFVPREGLRTANVIATLRGTTDPELVYVVSSHFDSVNRGPGADDNTSGTAALLEAARVLAARPQPATIQFAFFTGEEAGLLGSREYVRRAVERDVTVVGALNNDMVGFANDHRLDNTIRYSNAGIRDLQHAAAFLFTDLITYDAKYYKSTDAHAYYEAYGDIVGGIGSYPILGNPHYHRSHDVLETINHQLVAEVSKTTVATLMRLASSPARLRELEATRSGPEVTVRWRAAAESGVEAYLVAYGPATDPFVETRTVTGTSVAVPVPAGGVVSVKAVNARGLDGWDWARVTVP